MKPIKCKLCKEPMDFAGNMDYVTRHECRPCHMTREKGTGKPVKWIECPTSRKLRLFRKKHLDVHAYILGLEQAKAKYEEYIKGVWKGMYPRLETEAVDPSRKDAPPADEAYRRFTDAEIRGTL